MKGVVNDRMWKHDRLWKQNFVKFKNHITLFPFDIFVSNFVRKLDFTGIFDTLNTFDHLPDLHILQTRVTNTSISEKEAVSDIFQ